MKKLESTGMLLMWDRMISYRFLKYISYQVEYYIRIYTDY